MNLSVRWPLSRKGKRRPPASEMFDRRRRPALEALEDRVVPSITLSMGVLTITGTTGHDAFRISLQPGNSTNIEVSDGTMTQDFALSSVTSVVVNGVAGT